MNTDFTVTREAIQQWFSLVTIARTQGQCEDTLRYSDVMTSQITRQSTVPNVNSESSELLAPFIGISMYDRWIPLIKDQ